MRKVQKLGSWVPHMLNDNNIAVCSSLLARHLYGCQQHQSFLSRIVTGEHKRYTQEKNVV